MNHTDRIKQLQEQIETERRVVKNCAHDFMAAEFDPETFKQEYATGRLLGNGSDHWPEIEYRDKTRPRWSRQCKKCGHKQYTYQQAPVITGYQPKFS